jgi:hypothetical protein
MYKPERDRPYAAAKFRKAQREPVAVRRGNWVAGTNPPLCAIHQEVAVWHRNSRRASGGQWTCRACARDKSRGLRRKWRTEHTDPFQYNLKKSFTLAKHHSKKIGREFTITFDEVLALWEAQGGRCAISGVPMDHFPGDGERRRNKVTMDRIDCARGYTPDNVWLITDWANRAKSDLTREELLLFAHGVITGLSQSS